MDGGDAYLIVEGEATPVATDLLYAVGDVASVEEGEDEVDELLRHVVEAGAVSEGSGGEIGQVGHLHHVLRRLESVVVVELVDRARSGEQRGRLLVRVEIAGHERWSTLTPGHHQRGRTPFLVVVVGDGCRGPRCVGVASVVDVHHGGGVVGRRFEYRGSHSEHLDEGAVCRIVAGAFEMRRFSR